MAARECFGFFTGEWQCKEGGCRATVQCKALANSDTLDVASDVVEHLLESLPVQDYLASDSVRVVVDQLIHPERLKAVLLKSNQEAVLNILGNIPVQDDIL